MLNDTVDVQDQHNIIAERYAEWYSGYTRPV